MEAGTEELSLGKVQSCRNHWIIDGSELQPEVPLLGTSGKQTVLDAWNVFPWRHFKGKVSLRSLIQPVLELQCSY